MTYSSSLYSDLEMSGTGRHIQFGKDKFGRNENVGTSFEDVWAQGGVITYLSSAETIDIASDNAADTAAGTGCRKLMVEGVDNSYNTISEEVTLNGTSTVTTSLSFLRVNRAYCTDVGSNEVNAGDISFTASTASTSQALISADLGQTLKTQLTVPIDSTGFMTRFYVNVGKNDDASVRIMVREKGKSWRVKRYLKIYQNHITVDLNSYIPLPPESDVKIQALAGVGSIAVAAGFDYYLIPS